MSVENWFEPSGNEYKPFGSLYFEEFHLSELRTNQELISLKKVINIFPKSARVLDIAGGYGRVSKYLVTNNYVFNQDLNRDYLKKSSESGVLSAQGDMRHLSFKNNSFDICLLMFTTFGYFKTEEEDFSVLTEARRVLKPKGVFIIDLPNYQNILKNFQDRRELALSDGSKMHYQKEVISDFLIEKRWKENLEGEKIELDSIKLRVYFFDKIKQMCNLAGFSKVEAKDQNLKTFSVDKSKRLWIIASNSSK